MEIIYLENILRNELLSYFFLQNVSFSEIICISVNKNLKKKNTFKI